MIVKSLLIANQYCGVVNSDSRQDFIISKVSESIVCQPEFVQDNAVGRASAVGAKSSLVGILVWSLFTQLVKITTRILIVVKLAKSVTLLDRRRKA